MDFNRFTEKLQEGFRSAQALAAKRGHQQVDVEHLLLALQGQEGGLTQSLFAKAEIDSSAVHQRLMEELDKMPKVSGSAPGIDQVYVTPRLQTLQNHLDRPEVRDAIVHGSGSSRRMSESRLSTSSARHSTHTAIRFV